MEGRKWAIDEHEQVKEISVSTQNPKALLSDSSISGIVSNQFGGPTIS